MGNQDIGLHNLGLLLRCKENSQVILNHIYKQPKISHFYMKPILLNSMFKKLHQQVVIQLIYQV